MRVISNNNTPMRYKLFIEIEKCQLPADAEDDRETGASLGIHPWLGNENMSAHRAG